MSEDKQSIKHVSSHVWTSSRHPTYSGMHALTRSNI